uniref:RWP-RK domain-containing protein n=1 Tax=Tarenaya spinosa TaxID=228870 RepID=Q1KUV6_9ROSI|nr:hypothetical protein [Tarenaya spinosa]
MNCCVTCGWRRGEEQRERTGRLTLKDIGKYFHLPVEEAARIMKVCPTVVKKICRRGGLARWPHRKIRSIERKISKWKSVGQESRGKGSC